MSIVNPTISFTLPMTVILPRTITAETDPQTVDYACRAYHRIALNHAEHAGNPFSFSVLATFAQAMTEGDAVTTLYCHDGESKARTLFPSTITLTADNRVVVRAFDTLRRETRCFRLDRCEGAHLVVLPGEMIAA